MISQEDKDKIADALSLMTSMNNPKDWVQPLKDPRRMSNAQLKRYHKAPMRLERIERLKAMRAPAWIIKMEEVAYALNLNGMVASGLAGESSRTAQRLFDEHVLPLIGDPL